MKKIFVFTSFVLAFVLTASLTSISLGQIALGQDLSSLLKDHATKLLTGNDNSQRTDNMSESATDNSTSSDSSLTQRATDALSAFLK
jgi:hypothetical protein